MAYGDPAKTDEVFALLQDHLSGTSQVVDSSGNATRIRYGVWGAARDAVSDLPTSRMYTGQEKASNLGLYYYNARWYDSYLSRWIQPDVIVPGESSIYTPLIVDYSNLQFLEKSNRENRERVINPGFKSVPVPTNPLALDRYAYALNDPINNNDPSGYCIWDLCILEGIGVVELIILATATVGTAYLVTPGHPEAFAQSVVDLAEQATIQVEESITPFFARGEYVPPGLSETERNAYREAVHRYKEAYNLGASDNVDKKVLDKMAELVKKGVKPSDVVDKLPQPPEEDWEDDWDGKE